MSKKLIRSQKAKTFNKIYKKEFMENLKLALAQGFTALDYYTIDLEIPFEEAVERLAAFHNIEPDYTFYEP